MKMIFFVLPLIYIGANCYLFIRTLQAFSWLPLWAKVVLSIVFWVVVFSLFAAIGLRESHLPNALLKLFFRAGSVWMIFLLYMVMLLAVADLVKLAFPAMGNTFWFALPVTCLLLLYGNLNYRNPKMEHIEVISERSFEGENIRVVAISDVHLGYGTGLTALKKYIKLINEEKPDLILILGDLIDNSLKPIEQEPFDEALSMLNAPLGIYMAPGNHEYISGIEHVAEYLKKTPIKLLRDSVVALPNGIQIVGRDDCTNHHRAPLTDLLAKTNSKQPTIVLNHQPYSLAETDSLKVDLLLCGHTHRGQVFPLNLITDKLYEQSHGYRKWSYSHIWVSSGLSLWGPPFRIGTQSDFAVIDIKKYKQNN